LALPGISFAGHSLNLKTFPGPWDSQDTDVVMFDPWLSGFKPSGTSASFLLVAFYKHFYVRTALPFPARDGVQFARELLGNFPFGPFSVAIDVKTLGPRHFFNWAGGWGRGDLLLGPFFFSFLCCKGNVPS